jgi:predicted MFS family arabinose efflux permease
MVRREQIVNALALNQTISQLGAVVGPSLAGVVLAAFGIAPAFLINSITFFLSVCSVVCLAPIPAPAASGPRGPWLKSVTEGLTFVWRHPVIGSTFLVDINAMFFGGPRALFPALALDVLRVGQTGLGLLYAAPGAGALVAVLMSGWVGRVRHQGRAIIICAIIWGLAIGIFGLMRHFFLLALLVLAIAFAADATCAIFRSTILQLAVPDRLRGRLSAIHFLAVGTGPQLGNVESGVVAQLAGTEFSVVSGGIAAAIGAVVIALAIPAYIKHDVRDEEPELVAESSD